MINQFNIYNKGKIKEINSKTICDYIDSNFIPYIKYYIKVNERLFQFLTPLIVFNFGKIYENYNLMINEDIRKCQDQIALSLLEENENKKNKEMVKNLTKKTNKLEKKVSQLNEDMKKMRQEMKKKDEDMKKMRQEMKKKDEDMKKFKQEMQKKDEDIKKFRQEMQKKDEKINKINEEHEEKFKNIEKDVIQIKSILKIKNKELKMKNKELNTAKNVINNMEYKYEKLEELQNIIIVNDYSDKLTIKEKSQKIFENEIYIKKLQCINNILDTKNEILEEENIRIKKLIENKSCKKNEKDNKSLELIEMKFKIQELNEKNIELEEKFENISEIISDFRSERRKEEIFRNEELRERTKFYFSISHQRIRDLESKIAKKNLIISKLKSKTRKNTW